MMIDQGYVPATCTMDDRIAGPLIYSEISAGRSPCTGCHMDRSKCHGGPLVVNDPKDWPTGPIEANVEAIRPATKTTNETNQ